MRALLSVYDKTGITDFGQQLVNRGWEILSTGGTITALQKAGIPAIAVADVIQFPEILDGRVKTLHPQIHGALLARRDNPEHLAQLAEHAIRPIELVAVNLYPFARTISDPSVTIEEAIEQIDIGGPAMVRAAAKNFSDVIVITDPLDYGVVLRDLETEQIDHDYRRALAAKAFAHIASYDALVASYLRGEPGKQIFFPDELTIAGMKVRDLRYGENPQQRAAAYRRLGTAPGECGILDAVQLAGKAMSFNNLLDADAAWGATLAFPDPTVAIVKHTIPCGLAVRESLTDAFVEALAGDPISAFGGIVALNRPVDDETAQHLASVRFDIVIAPEFTESALILLRKRKSLRILQLANERDRAKHSPWDIRPIRGGFLVQEGDDLSDDAASWHVVTRREPNQLEWQDLVFAWEAVRHVKSNAIVMASNRAIVGVGSGQPNRVESVHIAAKKAKDRARGAVMASDAFFPFADGLQAGIDFGITAVAQPGGAVRDQEVIAAADAAGITMVFTGTRHFRH